MLLDYQFTGDWFDIGVDFHSLGSRDEERGPRTGGYVLDMN
jgi:hypothetical protein